MRDPFTSFQGVPAGRPAVWQIREIRAVRGDPLPAAAALLIGGAPDPGAAFSLRGVTSHLRYATRAERDLLRQLQPPLGRPEATCAALIPLRKQAAWWDLAQDERRRIFEEQSAHGGIGRRYLPAIARQLYHSRDLGEPFDFVTWFEFAPADAPAFQRLLDELRGSPEWAYVDREVEVRLVRTKEDRSA